MKKKTNISDKALKLINQKNIHPIPKWEFVAKYWTLWLGFGASLLLVVLAMGVSWFGLVDNIIIPNLWIVFAVTFLGLSFLAFQKTRKAYRFDKRLTVFILILIATTLGGVLFKVGIASRIDRGMESRFGFYRQIVPMRMVVWNNPKSGYLSGEIVSINSNIDFVIKDFSGQQWNITGNRPLVRGKVKMAVGEEIKLIGAQIDDTTFSAEEIRPWNGMGQNMMKENR